jgi:hypothetical protein
MVLASVPKSRATIHDKKRQGHHHNKSKTHYAKAYWPYIPMLLIVSLGMLLNTTWTAGKAVLGYATNVSPTSLLQEANIQRTQHSKAALTLNSQLAAAAQAKANDMVARNYWSHVAPDGKQPWQFVNDAGYLYASAGENLAYGFDSSSAATAGWMNSPGHKANILGEYKEVGFGIANGSNYQGEGEQTVIVAMYGTPQAVVTPSSAQYGTSPQITARVAGPTEVQKSETPASAPQASNTPATETPAATDPITSAVPQITNEPTSQNLQARQVSRVDVLASGGAAWAAIVVAVLGALAAIIFFYKHAKLWHRLLVKGEKLIVHHPFLDIAFVAFGVLGFVLTRTTGFIH